MTNHTHGPCPTWCDSAHHGLTGAVHRHEVGHLMLQGTRLAVNVVAVDGGEAQAAITGPPCMDISRYQANDAAEVFTLLGYPFLGELVKQAAGIAEEHNTSMRHAATTVPLI